MTIRTVTLAAMATVASAFAMPAVAQEEMMMEENRPMMISPTGEMMMMTESMDESMMKMAMKNATAVEDGTLFFMSDGKLYMMEDMKMENGKMMSEQMMMMKK
jgi:hypothetical protein